MFIVKTADLEKHFRARLSGRPLTFIAHISKIVRLNYATRGCFVVILPTRRLCGWRRVMPRCPGGAWRRRVAEASLETWSCLMLCYFMWPHVPGSVALRCVALRCLWCIGLYCRRPWSQGCSAEDNNCWWFGGYGKRLG